MPSWLHRPCKDLECPPGEWCLDSAASHLPVALMSARVLYTGNVFSNNSGPDIVVDHASAAVNSNIYELRSKRSVPSTSGRQRSLPAGVTIIYQNPDPTRSKLEGSDTLPSKGLVLRPKGCDRVPIHEPKITLPTMPKTN